MMTANYCENLITIIATVLTAERGVLDPRYFPNIMSDFRPTCNPHHNFEQTPAIKNVQPLAADIFPQ